MRKSLERETVCGGEEKEENIRSGEEEKNGDGKGGKYRGVLE